MTKEKLLLMMFRTLWATMFRSLLEAKVKQTPNEWDDKIIPMIDELLKE